jgi:hypothetical protein
LQLPYVDIYLLLERIDEFECYIMRHDEFAFRINELNQQTAKQYE